jgi:hypothetical protein
MKWWERLLVIVVLTIIFLALLIGILTFPHVVL